MGKVASKIWWKYVINLFVKQHNLPEIVKVAMVYILSYLINNGKLYYGKKRKPDIMVDECFSY